MRRPQGSLTTRSRWLMASLLLVVWMLGGLL